MGNTLTAGLWYDPYVYANEMLEFLKKNLGMAQRVNRSFDKAPNERGSVIQLRRPEVYAAEAMPAAAADITPDYVSITLDQWWGKTITLSDKEMAFSKEQVFNDYIQPMAYAVADKIDATLALLYKDVPWTVTNSSPCAVADLTALQRVMLTNKVPNNDRHLMLSPIQQEEFLNLAAFTQWQGAGAAGADSQMNGSLGTRYTFETFASQNVQAHAAGTSSDTAAAVDTEAAKGATSIILKSYGTTGETIKAGDIFSVAGNTQQYAVTTTTATAAGGTGTLTVAFVPPLVEIAHANDVVTVTLVGGTGSTTSEQGLAFHRNAFALAMGVLPSTLPGINVYTATDPASGLSIRARQFAVGLTAQIYLGVDALWGVKTLNPNMACRLVN